MEINRNTSVHNKTPVDHIGLYTMQEFLYHVSSFHGYPAPGVIIGGIMVEMATERIPKSVLYNAICETSSCLPDAIQLLTPCTVGNGWLNIIDLGRYALTLYDKYEGSGVRVYLDPSKLDDYDEIKAWFMKLKTKNEQNSNHLQEQILIAGRDIYTLYPVKVAAHYLGKHSKGHTGICEKCHEAYPIKDGIICKGCQGEAPYERTNL